MSIENLASAVLFQQTREYINDLIEDFGYAGFSRFVGVAISAGVVLMTLWLMIQGYRIATGQSRESMAV